MTHFLYRFAGLLAALMLSAAVHAQDIQVEGAWARATAAGRDSASIFMYVTSKQEATLVGASSPASRAVELRTMSHKGSMMKTLSAHPARPPGPWNCAPCRTRAA